MSVLNLFVLAALAVLGLSGMAAYKIRKARQENDRLLKAKQALEEKTRKQAVEIRQKNAEVQNAKTYRRNEENTRRVSASRVDEQLHQQGWFRDGDNYGVQCVRDDLSKPCGYDGNQTSDTGSQSDL